MKEFPSMVRRIEALHMHFLFEHPTECNLSLVCEFYANWDLRCRDSKVKIRGKVVTFTSNTLNILLGMPKVDAEPLKLMNVELPSVDIRYLLCGTRSTAWWKCHRKNETHVSLPFVLLNKEARLWAKIIYACHIHGTYLTEVTYNNVCLI